MICCHSATCVYRVEACICKLAELNPYVSVKKSEDALTLATLSCLQQYQVPVHVACGMYMGHVIYVV